MGEEKITITCMCGKEYQVGLELAGKTAKCKCGHRIKIPASKPPVPAKFHSGGFAFKVATGFFGALTILFACLWLMGLGGNKPSSTLAPPALSSADKTLPEKPQRNNKWQYLQTIPDRIGPGTKTCNVMAKLGTSVKEYSQQADCVATMNYLMEFNPTGNTISLTVPIVIVGEGKIFIVGNWFLSDSDDSDIFNIQYRGGAAVNRDVCKEHLVAMVKAYCLAFEMNCKQTKRAVTLIASSKIPTYGLVPSVERNKIEFQESALISSVIPTVRPFLTESEQGKFIDKTVESFKVIKEYGGLPSAVPKIHFDLGDDMIFTLHFGRLNSDLFWEPESSPYCEVGSVWTMTFSHVKKEDRKEDGWPMVSEKTIDKVTGSSIM